MQGWITMVEEFITYITEHGEDIARWASVIAIPLSAVAIAISIKIFRKTQHIESEQLKNAEGLYVEKTEGGLKQIQEYYNGIFQIIDNEGNYDQVALRQKIEDETGFSGEEWESITTNLNQYYKRHHNDMINLLQKIQRSLELWTNLKKSTRDNYDKILTDFEWTTRKFFPIDTKTEQMLTKIWTTEYEKFLEQKYFIDQILPESSDNKKEVSL